MVCLCFFFGGLLTVPAADQKALQDQAKDDQGYRIDKPGTITFTVGVKIKGKLEKPQVMIFLPKEKSVYNEVTITHSFHDAIMEPLPLDLGEK